MFPPPMLSAHVPLRRAAVATPVAPAAPPVVVGVGAGVRSSPLRAGDLEVTKSTSAHGSPHTSTKHTTRVQLKSPYKDLDPRYNKQEEELTGPINLNGDDEEAKNSRAGSASTAAMSTACPALPPPFPHRRPPSLNVLHELQSRQSGLLSKTAFQRRTQAHQFGRFELKRSVSTVSTTGSTEVLNVSKQSKIMEIIAVDNFLFALTHAGVCVAYDSRTLKRLCYLNVVADEVIRSLFHNKVNKSLITVSVYRHDNFTSLRCRSTPLDAIATGKPELGVSLFASESLQWPGFVEFDDVNKKVLTFSSLSKKYKIWDLANYQLMYDMSDPRIEEVKISPGVMLFIMKRTATSVPLRLVAIDTGEVLQEFNQPLVKGMRVQFIEQFNEKLLIKQKKQPLEMVDVKDATQSKTISQQQFTTPSAFIFLYENHFFLTFIKREIAVWNFSGHRVATFDDHFNWWADCNTNNIYINSDQDILVSYCLTPEQVKAMHEKLTKPQEWKAQKAKTGSINISSIFTGKCLGKIEKRKQLKYPLEILSPAQQQSAVAHYARCHGRRRGGHLSGEDPSRGPLREHTQNVLRAIDASTAPTWRESLMRAIAEYDQPQEVEFMLSMDRPQFIRHTAAAFRQEGGPAQANGDVAMAVEPAAPEQRAPAPRALDPTGQALALAQTMATAPAPPARQARVGTPSTSADEDDTMMMEVDRDDMDFEDVWDGEPDAEGRREIDHDATPTRTEDEEEAELVIAEAEEDLGFVPWSKVLFPNSLKTDSPTGEKPTRQLQPLELDLPDLAAYRQYNRSVRARNAALKDITAVFWDEVRNEIYTGNESGKIHVWGH